MEDDLEQQVAQLFLQVCVGAVVRVGLSEVGQRIEDLVALLDQVRHEGCMRLDRVPRAALAQRVHQRDELGHLVAGGAALAGDEGRDVDGREVVGLQRAVEFPPVDGRHHLVLEAEVVQEHRPGQFQAVVVGDGQLHLGEQVPRPALGHEERATLALRHGAGDAGVDEAHPCGQGIDPQRHPGQVQEGEGRAGGHFHPAVGPQQVDGALGDQRRPGHGVDDRVGRRLDRRRHQRLDDPAVDLVERRGRLVEVVEGRHTLEAGGRRVACRPEIGAPQGRRPRQLVSDVIPHEVGAGGPEAHHHDVGAAPRHAQPLDGVDETEPEDEDAAPAPELPAPEVPTPELPGHPAPVFPRTRR